MRWFLGRRSLALLLATLALSTQKVAAQSISGSIGGIVMDEGGDPLARSAIKATNTETGLARTTSTDNDGNYFIGEMSPGTYQVKVDQPFYRSATHRGVVVSVNRVTRENFVLSKPPPNQMITVASVAPVTDTDSATLTDIFSQRQIVSLPLLTRDVNSLALLAPGVFSVRTFSFASTLVPFAVNGARGRDNNFIIDSVDNNEPLFGGAATQFTNTDVFSEYSILTAVPKAEFGRGTGATVNVITRSGSNALHGTAFWFGQDDLFNASDRVEQTAGLSGPAPFYENFGGGTLGGPIRKDQAWFFVSYQADRASNNLSSVYPVVSTLPSAEGVQTLQGIGQPTSALKTLLSFPSVTNAPAGSPCTLTVNNPCTGPVAVPLDVAGLPASVAYGTYLLPKGNPFHVGDDQISGRLDYKISDSQSVYGRYLLDNLSAPQGVFLPPGEAAFDDLGVLPEERNFISQRTQSFLLDHRYYTVSAINEVRFAFSRIAQHVGPVNAPGASALPAATIGDDFGGFITQPPSSYQGDFLAAGNQFTIGQDTSPAHSDSNIFQAQENYSRVVGRHSFKFGGDAVYTQTNVSGVPSDLGHYFFGSSATNNPEAGAPGGLGQFISESANETNALAVFQRFPDVIASGGSLRQGPPEMPLRELDIFSFFQDDIRVKSNLTLNLGLRYEVYGQPINGLHQINPAAPSVSPDHNNFAPRFGFAWSPWHGHNTVVRGGYAISYSPMVLNIPLLIWQSGPVSPFVYTVTEKGAAYLGETPAQPPGVFPNLPILVPTTGSFPDSPLSLSSLQGVSVSGCSSYQQEEVAGPNPITQCSTGDTVDPHLVNPYVQNFTFGVQQELPHRMLLEIDGVGSKGTKLYQRLDINPFGGYIQTPNLANCAYIPFSLPAGDTCLANRADNSHGDILAITNGGSSTYYALQASLSKRTGPVKFTVAYTWSHMIDNASEIFGPGIQFFNGDVFAATTDPRTSQPVEAITPLPQDSSDLAPEKGNSSFDRRHRLAISYVWDVYSPKHGLGHTLLGGWELGGITQIQSGQPFTPLNSTPVLTSDPCADANGDGNLTNDRPAIGNPKAPLNYVALLASCQGVSSPTAYVDLRGEPIPPDLAHFVQVFGDAGKGGFNLAGRNILTGPGIVNFDVALYRNFKFTESKTLQLRWEVYDILNTPNAGFTLGNVFASAAQAAPAFAFSPTQTAARITGVIPENAIDARPDSFGRGGFLSQAMMNTTSRRMQFGVKFIF